MDQWQQIQMQRNVSSSTINKQQLPRELIVHNSKFYHIQAYICTHDMSGMDGMK